MHLKIFESLPLLHAWWRRVAKDLIGKIVTV